MPNDNPHPTLPEAGPAPRLRLRERRVDFAMLYREMHYCYGRLLGLEGIALWSWYRLHQHGGGQYQALTGYGWTGQPSILAAHGVKHHSTLNKLRERLRQAELLVLVRAQDIFSDEELEALRAQAREQGEKLGIQKGSYLAFVHDPLTREDFVRWSKGSQCPSCPIGATCPAYRAWQEEQGLLPTEDASRKGMSKNDIPSEQGMSKIDTPLEQGMSKNDIQGMSKNDTKPNRDLNNTSVVVLTARGVSEKVAQQLAKSYPPELIREKAEILDYLLETGSPQVARNPAGYLRRAIEENYAPPPGFRPRAEREAEQERQAQEEREREARWAQIRAQRRKGDFRERVAAHYGVSEELQRLWKRVQDELTLQMTQATYQTFVQHTMLISLVDGVARVAVRDEYAREWLAHRLHGAVQETLERIWGRAARLEFVHVRPEELG